MQFHLDAAHPPSKEDMVATMRRFGDLGVSIYITELDVNLINLRGAQSEKWKKQAQVYKDVVEACVESAVCKSVTIWGVSDRFSWLLNPEIQQRFNLRGEAPLIFDENYNPKPAYFAIRDALVQCAGR
jgi:endo-1,4-beta-xylanase